MKDVLKNIRSSLIRIILAFLYELRTYVFILVGIFLVFSMIHSIAGLFNHEFLGIYKNCDIDILLKGTHRTLCSIRNEPWFKYGSPIVFSVSLFLHLKYVMIAFKSKN
jgi:hypothetical protein